MSELQLTPAQRTMLAALLPGHWFGGKGASRRTVLSLKGLAHRGLMDEARDSDGANVWRLTDAGVAEWKLIAPATRRRRPQ